MSRAQNIHDTKKWKKKRKNHVADKCNRAKCGLCSPHKRMKNSLKFANKKQLLAKINEKETLV